MLDPTPSPAPAAATAVSFWELVVGSFASVLADARQMLGEHLREDGYAPRGASMTDAGAWCETATGRSALRLECSFAAAPASDDELALRAVFGSDAPLVRVFLWRVRGTTRRLESVLAADVASGRWACVDPPAEAHRFDEQGALERCLWASIGDPP